MAISIRPNILVYTYYLTDEYVLRSQFFIKIDYSSIEQPKWLQIDRLPVMNVYCHYKLVCS